VAPDGVKWCHSGRDAIRSLTGRPAYSQSLRLKMTYRLVHTMAIRAIAKGYPSAQCNSGMCEKFMP
jgi:hypothetical protein